MPQIHPKKDNLRFYQAKWLKPTTVRSIKPTLVWLTDECWSVPPHHIQSLSFGTLPSSRVKRNALFVSVSLKLPLPHTKTQMRTHRLKQTHKRHTESHTGIRQCCLFTVWRATVSTHACTRRHTDTRQRGGCVCSLAWQGRRMCLCLYAPRRGSETHRDQREGLRFQTFSTVLQCEQIQLTWNHPVV